MSQTSQHRPGKRYVQLERHHSRQQARREMMRVAALHPGDDIIMQNGDASEELLAWDDPAHPGYGVTPEPKMTGELKRFVPTDEDLLSEVPSDDDGDMPPPSNAAEAIEDHIKRGLAKDAKKKGG